ncbi:MAG: glycine--tRNA ligase subunit beta [Campylobacterota bacterium]
MLKPLLIEIGLEELPAVPLLKILDTIEKSWSEILEKNSLLCEFDFYYTPRRLVLWHREFAVKQSDSEVELWGPPLEIAYKEGEPTQAALGFAKKCGVSIDGLQKKSKGSKEFLYFHKVQEGKKSATLLEGMLDSWLESMPFGKMMRWGSLDREFIRPIRWLQIRFAGEDVGSIELFGIRNQNTTYVHKMASFEPVELDGYQAYFFELATNGVMLYQDKRKEKIVKEFESIEQTEGVSIDRDSALLHEVVAITENPKALMGEFDASFLQLPKEVIITSMKEHQRYFPVFVNGALTNKFVFVSNALTQDYSKVISGNERVLKPRLADAMFFYQNDLQNGLDAAKLKDIGFMQELGSVYDKVQREVAIASYLAKSYGVDEQKAIKATSLAKADLKTEMVDEFGNLQGLMGYYYAKALGEEEDVALAIKQQYLPLGQNSQLPSSKLSAIVAIANKLDSLLALFSIGKTPTGSKDPFALRRAVNGIIRIVTHYGLNFHITQVFDDLSSGYKPFDKTALEEFFIERIYKSFSVNRSIITAVLSGGERDVVKISQKIEALDQIVQSEGFEEVLATFKRVANISKDISLDSLEVDEKLFEKEQEKQLFSAFVAVVEKEYALYEQKLDALFGLKSLLDNYFDHVMVNSEDMKLRQNRLNTIASIYAAFKKIADIKEISV